MTRSVRVALLATLLAVSCLLGSTHSSGQEPEEAQSRAVGRMVSELLLPGSPYRMTLVAVCRNERPVEDRIDDVRIEVGDVAVLEVGESFHYVSAHEADFSLVKPLRGYRIRR